MAFAGNRRAAAGAGAARGRQPEEQAGGGGCSAQARGRDLSAVKKRKMKKKGMELTLVHKVLRICVKFAGLIGADGRRYAVNDLNGEKRQPH